MNSKEGLRLLETRCRFFAQDEDELQETYEAREAIQKDLEILDIFKSKNVDIKLIKELAKGKIMFDHYSYDYLTDEEYGKIKEWLEND